MNWSPPTAAGFADGVLAGVVEAWGKGSRRLLAGAGSPEHPVLAVARRSRAEQLGRGGRGRGSQAGEAVVRPARVIERGGQTLEMVLTRTPPEVNVGASCSTETSTPTAQGGASHGRRRGDLRAREEARVT